MQAQPSTSANTFQSSAARSVYKKIVSDRLSQNLYADGLILTGAQVTQDWHLLRFGLITSNSKVCVLALQAMDLDTCDDAIHAKGNIMAAGLR